MTVSSDTSRASYSGDGSTVTFAVPFYFLNDSDLLVVHRDVDGVETTWTLNTHYTVSGAGDPAGGSITVKTTPTDYTPAASERVVILRYVDITQETDYVENDAFTAEAHERALDKLTMINQQQTEELDRSIKLPISSTLTGITFPEAVANAVVKWNSAGTALEVATVANIEGSLDAVFSGVASGDTIYYDGTGWVNRTAAATLTGLGAQPLDSDLTAIAALTPTDGQVLTFSGSTWTAATPANATETDMRLAFLLLAELSRDRLNMSDGIADAYEDETDVDTSASTNQNYDATNDYYHNLTGGGTSDGGHTTPGVSGSGGTTMFDRTFSLTNGKTVSQVAIYSASAVTVKAKIGLENSSTDIDVVYDESFSHTGSGWETFNLTTPYAIPGSGTYRLGSYSASNMNRVNATHDVSYYSGDATGTGETYTAASNYSRFCQAIYAEVISDMTIVSEAFTADSEPDIARIHVQAAPQEAITINTDLLADVSRDDGSTWTTATLVAVQTLADGTIAYEDNEIDISAQPSGTDMRYRIRTANTKSIQIHGTVEQWA
jgi:hypothetical protein